MLKSLPLDIKPLVLPDDVRRLLREADERLHMVVDPRRAGPIAGFVPSDYVAVYGALRAVVDSGALDGAAFCEWGSGLGVVSDMAAMLGLDACGIEIEADLVDEARRLAGQFDLPVQFVHGSFLPPGCEIGFDDLADTSWLALDGPDAYDELGLDVDDFGLVFVYPWPGEEHVMDELFDRYAARGALLLSHHGYDDMRLQRKL